MIYVSCGGPMVPQGAYGASAPLPLVSRKVPSDMLLYCIASLCNRARCWSMKLWIFFILYLGLYFSYAFLYIVSGIFRIFQKRWCLGLQNHTWKLGISHWNSNFEVLSFVGCHTPRVVYWDSKTHGEGITSIGLTSFELWPKNCKFFLMKNAIFWLFLQCSKPD